MIPCISRGARRPAGKARRPRILVIFEEGATQPDGMPPPASYARNYGSGTLAALFMHFWRVTVAGRFAVTLFRDDVNTSLYTPEAASTACALPRRRPAHST